MATVRPSARNVSSKAYDVASIAYKAAAESQYQSMVFLETLKFMFEGGRVKKWLLRILGIDFEKAVRAGEYHTQINVLATNVQQATKDADGGGYTYEEADKQLRGLPLGQARIQADAMVRMKIDPEIRKIAESDNEGKTEDTENNV